MEGNCTLIGAMLVGINGPVPVPINPPETHECTYEVLRGRGCIRQMSNNPLDGVDGNGMINVCADVKYKITLAYRANFKYETTEVYILEYECCNLEGNCCKVREFCDSVSSYINWVPDQDKSNGDNSVSNVDPPGSIISDMGELISYADGNTGFDSQAWYDARVQECMESLDNRNTPGLGCPPPGSQL